MPNTNLGELFTQVLNTLSTAADVEKTASTLVTKANPTFTGALSLGRKVNTTVGANSYALGFNVEASGYGSHAEGYNTVAKESGSHAEGYRSLETFTYNNETIYYGASGGNAHSEGSNTIAKGQNSHAEG